MTDPAFSGPLDADTLSVALELLAEAPPAPGSRLPGASPDALAEASRREPTRRLLLGALFSPVVNHRRWVVKHAGHLSPCFADRIARGMLEAFEPLRPAGELSLLGSWEGLSSPVGAAIVSGGLARAPSGRQRYAPAGRYLQQAMEAAMSALGRLDPAAWAPVREFCEAVARSHVDREPKSPFDGGGVHGLPDHWIQVVVEARVPGPPPPDRVVPLLEAWLDGRATSDEEPDLAAWLAARLSDGDRAVRTRRLRYAACELVGALPEGLRRKWFRIAEERASRLRPKEHRSWFRFSLGKLAERYPELATRSRGSS